MGIFYFVSAIRHEPHWQLTEAEGQQLAHHASACLKGIRKNAAWLKAAERYAPWISLIWVIFGLIAARVVESNQRRALIQVSVQPGPSGPGGGNPRTNGSRPHPEPVAESTGAGRAFAGPFAGPSEGVFTPDSGAAERDARFRADLGEDLG